MRKNVFKKLILLVWAMSFVVFTGCRQVQEEIMDTLSDMAQEYVSDYVSERDKEYWEQNFGMDVVVPELSMPEAGTGFDINSIPEYNGWPYVEVNGNVPYFTEEELTTGSYEFYSELDGLGRCGVCVASVGIDLMPTEERGSIGHIKPTGWQSVKYAGLVEGNYLYNRCHLLGYQLTGENDNEKNLITGTRYMNTEGMLPFENDVAEFVEYSDYHVLYRVTPIFEENNLVASGVLLEAKSVEDNGDGLQFNVFCYNVQPGIVIDYATGNSRLDK